MDDFSQGLIEDLFSDYDVSYSYGSDCITVHYYHKQLLIDQETPFVEVTQFLEMLRSLS